MSTWQRLLWFPIVPLAILLPLILIAGGGDAQELVVAEIHPLAWALIALLLLIVLGVICFATAYFAINLWRAIRRLFPHRNE